MNQGSLKKVQDEHIKITYEMDNMEQPYTYRLRPGFGSEELLIEFGYIGDNPAEFIIKLTDIFIDHGFEPPEVQDFWINDETLFHFKSRQGILTVSKDIWDMVFITGEGESNQQEIMRVDKILSASALFEKEEVDHSRYKNWKI